jgi:hypothetical protein
MAIADLRGGSYMQSSGWYELGRQGNSGEEENEDGANQSTKSIKFAAVAKKAFFPEGSSERYLKSNSHVYFAIRELHLDTLLSSS